MLSLGEDTLTLRDIDQVSEAGRLDRNQAPRPLISEHKCSALYLAFIVSSENCYLIIRDDVIGIHSIHKQEEREAIKIQQQVCSDGISNKHHSQ